MPGSYEPDSYVIVGTPYDVSDDRSVAVMLELRYNKDVLFVYIPSRSRLLSTATKSSIDSDGRPWQPGRTIVFAAWGDRITGAREWLAQPIVRPILQSRSVAYVHLGGIETLRSDDTGIVRALATHDIRAMALAAMTKSYQTLYTDDDNVRRTLHQAWEDTEQAIGNL
jgi:hypothetical protein